MYYEPQTRPILGEDYVQTVHGMIASVDYVQNSDHLEWVLCWIKVTLETKHYTVVMSQCCVNGTTGGPCFTITSRIGMTLSVTSVLVVLFLVGKPLPCECEYSKRSVHSIIITLKLVPKIFFKPGNSCFCCFFCSLWSSMIAWVCGISIALRSSSLTITV